MITNILTYLEDSVAKWADKVALSDDKNALTFTQWNQLSRNIGAAIAQKPNMKITINNVTITVRVSFHWQFRLRCLTT